ncbi:MAG: UvrD-helicase domain-containing protein [Deltaproteobacteria bacterium]|nr:UvrD-helicase domain-containing protein [Deltaproteobacteria bacterium]
MQGLNPQQVEAVEYNKGPLLILAGAGSGKTRVITYKIAYLIKENKINPFNILALTFTNKAAQEIKFRVSSLINRSVDKLWIGTFHSTCVRILRKHAEALGYSNPFTIFDDQDSLSLVKACLKEMNIDANTTHPKAVQAYIDRAKNKGLLPQDYAQKSLNFFEEKVSQVYARYQSELKKNNAMDFGDLLLQTVLLFKQKPETLSEYQDQFQYVLIDEYQDTNRIQYLFADSIAKAHQNICVVGDEDQSIYRWRGADINNILDFEKDYAHAKIIKLEQNYRSTKNIIEAAKHMISHNKDRHAKSLWTENNEGDAIHVWVVDDEYTEAEFIIQEIKKLCLEENYNYNDCAIFYRVNALSRVLEDVLRKNNINYQVFGGFRFYERKEIKDLLAYLKLILNPHDSISFLRVLNVPARKIGKTSIEKITTFATYKNISLYEASQNLIPTQVLQKKQRTGLENFIKLIGELIQSSKSKPPSDILKDVCEKTKYLVLLKAEKTLQAQSRIENLEELMVAIQEFEERSENPTLSGFVEQVTLSSDLDNLDENTPTIKLLTAHAAKGLEFPNVFIVGMEEGLLPHSQALMDEDEIEEERRLFYVGMTRAKEKLFLTRTRYRRVYGSPQFNDSSRFLEEIPEKYLQTLDITSLAPQFKSQKRKFHHDDDEIPTSFVSGSKTIQGIATPFKRGERVSHPAFGKGEIVDCSQDKATIRFLNGEIKKFVLAYTPLEKL